MALTVEEKLKRLSDMEDWPLFSPQQQAFLKDVANNVDPERAYANNYAETKNPRFAAGRLIQYKNIKRALETIGYEKPKPVYTKQEALESLTYRMRKQGLEEEMYLKLLTLYSRLQGWDKPKPTTPSDEDQAEDVNQAVIDQEKKRREEG